MLQYFVFHLPSQCFYNSWPFLPENLYQQIFYINLADLYNLAD